MDGHDEQDFVGLEGPDAQNDNQAEQVAGEVIGKAQGAMNQLGELAAHAIGPKEFNKGLMNGSITGSYRYVNGVPTCLKNGVPYPGMANDRVEPLVIDGSKMIPC